MWVTRGRMCAAGRYWSPNTISISRLASGFLTKSLYRPSDLMCLSTACAQWNPHPLTVTPNSFLAAFQNAEKHRNTYNRIRYRQEASTAFLPKSPITIPLSNSTISQRGTNSWIYEHPGVTEKPFWSIISSYTLHFPPPPDVSMAHLFQSLRQQTTR